MANGIHPHYDFVNNKIQSKYPFLKKGEGIFGLSEEEKNKLNLINPTILQKRFLSIMRIKEINFG